MLLIVVQMKDVWKEFQLFKKCNLIESFEKKNHTEIFVLITLRLVDLQKKITHKCFY